MTERKGKLIVIAGIDGSGKATQAALLAERVRAAGRAAEILDFPQYEKSFFGEMVGAYLRGDFGAAAAVDPRLASLMYAGDRWQAKPRLEALLAAGAVVVCNRYVEANMAHQGGKFDDSAARRSFCEWEDRLEFGVYGLPRPDRVIFLHVPPEVAQTLVDAKAARAYLKGRKRDIHEDCRDHLRRASQVYAELSARERNWVRVECLAGGRLQTPEQIAELVWAAAKPLLISD